MRKIKNGKKIAQKFKTKAWYVFTILNIEEWEKERENYSHTVYAQRVVWQSKYKSTTNNIMPWDVKICSYSFLFIFFPWPLQKIFFHFASLKLVPNVGCNN